MPDDFAEQLRLQLAQFVGMPNNEETTELIKKVIVEWWMAGENE